MKTNFEKAAIMSGEDYPLSPTLTLHHPTVGEILSLNGGQASEETYWFYVHLLLSDPYSNMIYLDDIGMDFMKTTPFEVFLLHWDNMYQDFLVQALRFFIAGNRTFVKAQQMNGFPCLVDKNDADCQINEEVYEHIYEWIKAIHQIDTSKRINPADENARKILIADTREEQKKKQRKKNPKADGRDYIGGLMSAVSLGGNGAITPFNINDCKLYWLFEAFRIETSKIQSQFIFQPF